MLRKISLVAAALLGTISLAGCQTDGKDHVTASAVVSNPQTNMGAFTNQARAGHVTAESACVQPVPGSRNCIGAVVVSRPGVFRPSVVAVIPVDCQIDPKCKPGPVMGGIGEPTGNVIINGVAAVAGAYVGRGRGSVMNFLVNNSANAENNNLGINHTGVSAQAGGGQHHFSP